MQAAVRSLILAALVAAPPALAGPAAAQTALPLKRAPQRTQTAITPADLMTRVYLYADDSMMGRSSGSEYNLKATAYIAAEARRLGLRPAGDSGGYFQSVPLVKRQLDPAAGLSVEGTSFRPWDDFVPRDPQRPTRPFDGAQAVFAGFIGDSGFLAPELAAGKLVVIGVRPGPGAAQLVNRPQLLARYRTSSGIVVAALESFPQAAVAFFRQPQISLQSTANPPPDTAGLPVYFYMTAASGARLFGAPLDSLRPGALGKVVRGSVAFGETPVPARNVVAVLPGSDPKLRGQYVAVGAHNDHVGFDNDPVDHDSLRLFNAALRQLELAAPNHQVTPEQRAQIRVNLDSLRAARPAGARRDSIFNGADDDGSGTTAVLEIAEAFAGARVKPKRSIIFVWHTGEELGLFGARFFTDNPTVPRDSIVAQLNLDMVGRGGAGEETSGGPGYLQLIGTRRLSTELGDMIESLNKTRRRPFTFDYQYDATGHPEQFYCRSDHYMYARYGIPVAFFTTGGHGDYHQVTDEPQYIDYDKLTAVSQFVHDVAAAVANLDHRVVVDKPKPDPRGNCVQ